MRLLLLLLLWTYSFSTAAGSLASELRTCLASKSLNQQNPIDLANQCPTYYSRLQQLGILQTLEPLPERYFSKHYLQQLNTLTKKSTQVQVFDRSELDGLLAALMLDTEAEQSQAWWNSFLAWLDSLKPEQYEHEYRWLVEFLQALSLSEQTVTTIIYAFLILIAVLAIALVLYECYIAGVFSRVAQQRRKKSQTTVVQNYPDTFLLAEIKKLNPCAQIAALLIYIIKYLSAQQQLPEASSLTNQEFSAYLQRHHSQQHKVFEQLIYSAEPVLYGNQQPSAESLQGCWQYADRILVNE